MLLWPFLPFLRWPFLPVTLNGGVLIPRIAPPIPGVRAEVPITAVIAKGGHGPGRVSGHGPGRMLWSTVRSGPGQGTL